VLPLLVRLGVASTLLVVGAAGALLGVAGAPLPH
jgi:hypothetical protein